MKATKVPNELMNAPHYNNFLRLDSVKIIESCTSVTDKKGAMFLKDHMLLFVLEGTKHILYGNQRYTVSKNQMVLLKKNISFDYHKTGDLENNHSYDCIMFFLKDEFVLDYIKMAGIKDTTTEEMARITVKKVKEPLLSFVLSIKPYFNDASKISPGLIRLKMLELLYDLANTDRNLLLQLLQLKQQVVADIPQIIEENYTNPLSLEDFAYLSGRSLSSFKRDFQLIYKVSPGNYIRERRLKKAKELLTVTELPVKDICYETGFDNVAHFSRLFKSFFGSTPSQTRAKF
ncbi:AraC family transcriptional regulator [Chryseobacterium shigense]|uniref:AraC-type DNA-binding protein n=1 Tax=Chryseobacterium shigense TaxID=297244 RepID=A0A1N7I869_9FLAO|nr:AraC family transcriptional regulator [Chryseobacterium shigense]PQA97228.1 AraC family transcriptional regulator [Chryseobacterium shigense]SIS33286.1 AraC-type DNA-binding protein [Chryseobacterium shigense]